VPTPCSQLMDAARPIGAPHEARSVPTYMVLVRAGAGMGHAAETGDSEELADASNGPLSTAFRGAPASPAAAHRQLQLRARVGAIIGRCLTEDAVCERLRLEREKVREAAEDLRLLRLVTTEGMPVYPQFQFDGDAVIPGLPDVLRALRAGGDAPWAWSLWLTARDPHGPITRLADSYIDRLWDGEVHEVVREAHQAAARWAATWRGPR